MPQYKNEPGARIKRLVREGCFVSAKEGSDLENESLVSIRRALRGFSSKTLAVD
jgi:hypothetical protein